MSDLGNKEIFSKNLRYYMTINNKTRNDICKDLDFKYTTFTDWYNGNIYPRIDKIEQIANYFRIEKSDLIEDRKSNNFITSKLLPIAILGRVPAGEPLLAIENIEGYLPIDPSMYGISNTEDFFFLRVSGESMNKLVKNGSYVLIRKQDYAEDGDIIVAIVNGDNEATLKRYKKLNEQFVLLEPMSSDPSIEAITVDLKTTDFHIIGKAIGQFGKF